MPANIEICANCMRTIGALETACLWGDAIVCGECRARLEATQNVRRQPVDSSESTKWPELIDDAAPRGPRPNTPFFTLGPRIHYIPLKRIKLVGVDPNTQQQHSGIIQIHENIEVPELCELAKKETGVILTKVVVLERLWGEKAKYSTLEKGVIGLGIASLLIGDN